MKRYDVRAKAGRNELLIYGDIGLSWFEEESNDAKTVVSKISEMTGPLDVYVNSRGGSVADAIAIHSALLRYDGPSNLRNGEGDNFKVRIEFKYQAQS